jgi:twinkle protein
VRDWDHFGIDTKGKTTGDIRTLCPQCSPHRKKKTYPCLHVDIDKGVWCCHHCGWAGTIKAGQWQRPEIRKTYVKPEFAKAKQANDVHEWFKSRGIPSSVVERNGITKGIAYFPQVEEERPCVLFPYYRGEEVINIKYRTRDKLFRMAAGAERILYGINDIGETVIVCEGEVDKLSIEVAGFTSCVSVPDGAPAPDTQNYSSKFDYLQAKELEKVKTFIIAVDNDAPGVRLQQELVRRLGCEKCLIVTWPDDCKDANDVLIKHGPAFLEDCLSQAKPLPIEGTHKAGDMIEQIRNEYLHGAERGLDCGWNALSDLYRVMPGEWTAVTGIPGHGKSEWLDALSVNLALREGWTFGVFSPENQPLTYHIQKLAEKYIGKPFSDGPTERMNQADLDRAITWVDQHYTFMLPELPTVETLLEIASRLVLRHGIRGLIIDPWNEIDHSRANGMTETEHISQMLTKIRSFARNHGVHVWVVAHPTKLQKGANGEYPVPTPYDISGSSHWRNKADNCITIHRDMKENDDRVQIHVQKVRKKANGKVGTAILQYNSIVGQYRDETGGVMPRAFAKKHLQEVA